MELSTNKLGSALTTHSRLMHISCTSSHRRHHGKWLQTDCGRDATNRTGKKKAQYLDFVTITVRVEGALNHSETKMNNLMLTRNQSILPRAKKRT